MKTGKTAELTQDKGQAMPAGWTPPELETELKTHRRAEAARVAAYKAAHEGGTIAEYVLAQALQEAYDGATRLGAPDFAGDAKSIVDAIVRRAVSSTMQCIGDSGDYPTRQDVDDFIVDNLHAANENLQASQRRGGVLSLLPPVATAELTQDDKPAHPFAAEMPAWMDGQMPETPADFVRSDFTPAFVYLPTRDDRYEGQNGRTIHMVADVHGKYGEHVQLRTLGQTVYLHAGGIHGRGDTNSVLLSGVLAIAPGSKRDTPDCVRLDSVCGQLVTGTEVPF